MKAEPAAEAPAEASAPAEAPTPAAAPPAPKAGGLGFKAGAKAPGRKK
ncbi:hypothetical protein [Rhodococcus erythropolis]|nr:hypothetical protein [Rhodococcus erythropolis]